MNIVIEGCSQPETKPNPSWLDWLQQHPVGTVIRQREKGHFNTHRTLLIVLNPFTINNDRVTIDLTTGRIVGFLNTNADYDVLYDVFLPEQVSLTLKHQSM